MKPNRKARLTGWLPAALTLVLGMSNCNCERPPLTPLQEETEVIKSLEKSGSVPENLKKDLEPKAKELWSATFRRGLDNLHKQDPETTTALVKVGSVACFRAGCMVKLWFKDRVTVRGFEDGLLIGPESPLRVWPGRIYRGPLIEDGSQGGALAVRATWALMINHPRYKELAELATEKHAAAMPDQSITPNTTISDLQRGEP
jgi:hypothetical protein